MGSPAATRLEVAQAALAGPWADNEERVVELEPFPVVVRKRGRRYDLDDGGAAVARAGAPDGWLELAEEIVAEEGFNVNRRGVVFVPAVEGRDLASLAARLSDSADAVHAALLDAAT
jgi:hypothetical protein